jgi:hypothetical protein
MGTSIEVKLMYAKPKRRGAGGTRQGKRKRGSHAGCAFALPWPSKYIIIAFICVVSNTDCLNPPSIIVSLGIPCLEKLVAGLHLRLRIQQIRCSSSPREWRHHGASASTIMNNRQIESVNHSICI